MFEAISGQLNRFVNGKIPLKNIEKDAGTDSSTSGRHFEAGKLQFNRETRSHVHTEALPSLSHTHTAYCQTPAHPCKVILRYSGCFYSAGESAARQNCVCVCGGRGPLSIHRTTEAAERTT